MKKRNKSKKILPFPAPPRDQPLEDSETTVAIFQVGSDRFAVHMWSETLPPLPRQLRSEPDDQDEEPTLSLVPPRRGFALKIGASAKESSPTDEGTRKTASSALASKSSRRIGVRRGTRLRGDSA